MQTPVVSVATTADPIGWVDPRPRRLASLRRPPLAAGLGVLALLAAAALAALSLHRDFSGDMFASLSSVGATAASLRWQFTAVVLVLAGLHYLATSLAARAASSLPLPLGETLLVQLAAAAANRVTPAGLGGSAVTARYFHRRGLELPAAIGAVATLSAVGPLTDLVVLVLLVRVGGWVGLHGGDREMGVLVAKVSSVAHTVCSPVTLLLAGGGLVLLLALIGVRRLRGTASRFVALHPVHQLVRRPRTLLTLMLASGSTTLIMAFAFVASVAMVPGPRPSVQLGALLIAFMLGSAAGTVVPVPSGLGSTEAALIAVLVSFGVPAGQALQQVVIFRLLTFWLPAACGVLATRRLRRRAAL